MLVDLLDKIYFLTIKKYITDELEKFIIVFAVAIYADKKIKGIEIMSTDIIIEEYIKHYFDDKEILDVRKIRLIKEYMHNKVIELLAMYKKDIKKFEKDKLIIIKYLSQTHKKEQIIEYIKRIVESDKIITPEEKILLKKIME